ncbi:hypothetical protein ACJ41O_006857 [Fusarium nematophilum]
MPSQIRLRLVIRRHAVPEVKLVWPCTAAEDLTVSKLLTQVNEVVPLESGDWGLEDYAVELSDGKGDSFELLHFQQVGKVLKEDDQVVIRSLLTDDLRRRRLSGRHQISEDGKHLIDGLAFGRPWLRAPRDRPSLDLPPRKRARITHEEELDEGDDEYTEEEDQSERRLLESPGSFTDDPSSVSIRAQFFDSDPNVGFEDDDEFDSQDRDFLPTPNVDTEPTMDDDAEISEDEEGDVDLTEELRFLQEDNALIEQTPPVEPQSLLPADDSQNPQALLPAYVFDLSLLDKITALRAAFPLTPVSTIQAELLRQEKDLRMTFQALGKSNEPTVSFDEVMDRALIGSYGFDASPSQAQESPEPGAFGSRGLELPGRSVPPNMTRPLIEVVEDPEDLVPNLVPVEHQRQALASISVVQEDEETSNSSSSSESDSDSDSDEEEDEESGESDDDSDDDSDDASSDSDSDSDSASDSDSDSDGGSDSSSSGGEARGGGLFPGSQHDEDAMDTSSSDSSNSSDSDSDLESASDSGEVAPADDSDDSSDSSSDDDSSSSSDDSDSASEPEELSSKTEAQPPKAPAVPETIYEATAIDSATDGPPAPGAGLTRTKKRNARRREAKRLKLLRALEDTQSQSPPIKDGADEDAEFQARKRALLSAVSDENGIDGPAPLTSEPIEQVDTTINEPLAQETPASEAPQETASSVEPTPTQRRLKVDMGAGRRLLFGALGLKNPKSKAEEDKLRKNLMKDVKPLENPRVQNDGPKADVAEATPAESDEDPEAWREKIMYRAVECCHEGMVLSEPPFPFVQRWDPQQQYGSMRKRKRTSQNFLDESYYDEGSQWNGDEADWDDNSQKKQKKSKKRKSKGAYDEELLDSTSGAGGENDDADVVLNYDDIPAKSRPESSQFTDMDDLPSLPSDLTTLPSLEPSDAKPGMVITWKQLLLSKGTNWQPEVVSVTGLILTISEDNSLHVLLAKRDREPDDREYDEHTGKRIYAKFEAPALDEDDDEPDDGRRDITWAEMQDTRLVQQAPSTGLLETPANGADPADENEPVQNGDATADNNKVSNRQDRDETMAEELDTQEVRAEVEADLRAREAARKPVESDKSTSIPSGQEPPRFEFTTSGDDSPISSLVRPADTPSDIMTSPTRQLQETLHAAMVREQEAPLSHDSKGPSPGKEEEESIYNMDTGDSSFAIDESGLGAIIPDSIPSPELPPLPSKDDAIVHHRTLAVPSSVGSIRSGRQPPSNSGLEELPEERIEDSVIAETVPRPHERTPSPRLMDVPRHSSSPFPSLEEIFHTAATSRLTQSPMKSTQQSVLRSLKPGKGDLEYEEAMRRLDEGEEESDPSPDRNKSIRSLFPHATQPEPSGGLPKLPTLKLPKLEVSKADTPATPPTSQRVKQESPFVILAGSQVIELSSSPPSVQFTENYALDSEDETYQDSPLPQGSGWVQKKTSDVTTRSRGKSLPAVTTNSAVGARTRLTRGRTSLPPARDASASAFSQIKGRRKSTRKF